MSGEKALTVLELNDQRLKIAEVGIVCSLLFDCRQIAEVQMAKNGIDAKSLGVIADCLKDLVYVTKLDLSQNPLKFPDENLSGLEKLQQVCQEFTHVCEIKLNGISMPELLKTKMTHSLMVNRSIRGSAKGYHFNGFVDKRVRAVARPDPVNAYKDWKPSFSIDYIFSTLNRIPETAVEVHGDEIMIIKREREKKLVVEF